MKGHQPEGVAEVGGKYTVFLTVYEHVMVQHAGASRTFRKWKSLGLVIGTTAFLLSNRHL